MHAHDWQENLVEKRVTYTLEIDGSIIVIDNVPARVNAETGEQLFSPETVEKIHRMILTSKPDPDRFIRVPVYHFESPIA